MRIKRWKHTIELLQAAARNWLTIPSKKIELSQANSLERRRKQDAAKADEQKF